jgi:hypothetical protein
MAGKPVARPGTSTRRRRIAPTASLKVDTKTLTRAEVDTLLNDFAAPNWPWPKDPVVYKALIVHGSPFVSLSISPTRASQD